jgi:gluconate 2-dehydrogenase gamma chain
MTISISCGEINNTLLVYSRVIRSVQRVPPLGRYFTAKTWKEAPPKTRTTRHSQSSVNAKDVVMSAHDAAPSNDGSVFPRRRLLRDASLLAGGAVAAGVLGAERSLAGATPTTRPTILLRQTSATPVPAVQATPVDLSTYVAVNLTDTELTTLKAALDRIFPPDDLGPSANEMGVFVYIDRGLSERNAATLPLYQNGLAALDSVAGAGGFAGLTPEAQDEILTDIEAGTIDAAPAGFFATLLQHTREGMFSDPMYGGNVNFAGWDFIGYPGVKLVWTAEDQAIGSTPKPEHISVAQYGGTAS